MVMNIGILAVQGAVSEHKRALKRAFSKMGEDGTVQLVKNPEVIHSLEGLIIPGGESSTISRLIDSLFMRDTILECAKEGLNIMGTCAGSILMAKEGDYSVERTDTELLGFMDIRVARNSFGRQKESFECLLDIMGVTDNFPCIFIRAPAIEKVWGGCTPLAGFGDYIVAAEQKNYLALSFHPELTTDTRIHEYFLKKISKSHLHRPSKNS